ncbi:MAG: hypothetical protein AAF399_14095 [Bacteroidota bacterium]
MMAFSFSKSQEIVAFARRSYQNLTQAARDLAELLPHGLEATEVVALAHLSEKLSEPRPESADHSTHQLRAFELMRGIQRLKQVVSRAFAARPDRKASYQF